MIMNICAWEILWCPRYVSVPLSFFTTRFLFFGSYWHGRFQRPALCGSQSRAKGGVKGIARKRPQDLPPKMVLGARFWDQNWPRNQGSNLKPEMGSGRGFCYWAARFLLCGPRLKPEMGCKSEATCWGPFQQKNRATSDFGKRPKRGFLPPLGS